MYQPDWNKHLTDYVSKTLDEAFTKVQSEFIPLMSPIMIPKKTKRTKTELEKQLFDKKEIINEFEFN